MVCAQVLDNVWVLYGTQKMTLLLKSLQQIHCCSWNSELLKSRVEDFSSTGQVITHGLTDSTIRPTAQRFSFEEFNSLIVMKVILGLLSHVSSRPANKVAATGTTVEIPNTNTSAVSSV